MGKSNTFQIRARFSISREHYEQLKRFQKKLNYKIGDITKISLINTMHDLEMGRALKMTTMNQNQED